MFQSPGPIAFSVGPITVHWYGILIVIGIISAYVYALFEAKRRNLEQKIIDEIATWIVLGGVIGARLYYVLFNLTYYIDNPLEIFQIWKGGLAIHGALLGGAAVYFLTMWRKKLSLFIYADVIIPGLILSQAIGRFGNFFNNEAFGTPTSLPWALFIPADMRPLEFTEFAFFHPTFLYESLWNFIGFIVLVLVSRKKTFMNAPGSLLALYMIYYSFGRFWIEWLRTDSLFLGPLKAAQVVSILAIIGGLVLLNSLLRRRRVDS